MMVRKACPPPVFAPITMGLICMGGLYGDLCEVCMGRCSSRSPCDCIVDCLVSSLYGGFVWKIVGNSMGDCHVVWVYLAAVRLFRRMIDNNIERLNILADFKPRFLRDDEEEEEVVVRCSRLGLSV